MNELLATAPDIELAESTEMLVLTDLCPVDAHVTAELPNAVVLGNFASADCHVTVLAEKRVQDLNSVRKK